MLEKLFGFREHHTNVSQEILAGVTTFLTMSYIIFVQPLTLSKDFLGNPTGLDFGAVLLATCLISAFSCIFMGLYANYPIALAPGMGENFFFVSVIMALTSAGFQDAWQVALGIVFISGVIFLLLTILKVREAIIETISPSLRNGIAVGIGLFISFIGFQQGGLIVSKPGTLVGLTHDLLSPDVLVFCCGLTVTSILRARRIKGDILIGIVLCALLAFLLGEIKPSGIFGLPQVKEGAMFKMDLKQALHLTCIPFIIVFVFMDVFDTIGTLMGVAETANFMKKNTLPRANRVLLVDAIGTMSGACLGTSTVTSYIESITGVTVGGRTGFTSVIVGGLFLFALLFSPLISMIGNYPPITAAALVIVGTMMMKNINKIFWNDHTESIPAFFIIIGIPFSYSIADGLALGFIIYPIIKLCSNKGKQVSWLMYILSAALLLYFIFIRTKLG